MARSSDRKYFAVAFCNCWIGQARSAPQSPDLRMRTTRGSSDEGQTRLRRAREEIGHFFGGDRRKHCAGQLLQPSSDRPGQRVFDHWLDRRRVFQRFEQHRRRMLAVMPDRTAALGREFDRVGIADLDKDMIGPWARSLDRRDQSLAALVGMQIANRATALIRRRFSDFAGKQRRISPSSKRNHSAAASRAPVEETSGKGVVHLQVKPRASERRRTALISGDRLARLSRSRRQGSIAGLARFPFRRRQMRKAPNRVL